MTSNITTTSPIRASNEALIRDGLINLDQVNHILRNPELPKSRLQMNNILKKYNEQKRRALTLSRIQCTANSNLLTRNYDNSCDQNNLNQEPNEVSSDLDQLSDFEVKFSHLPQELLINILGETFAKYENEINKRENERKGFQSVLQKSSSVKEEVVSDSEDECRIIDEIDGTVLKQKLKDMVKEYQSVENQEIIISNELEAISQKLEQKLSELRECIQFCETLKHQNISITEKQDNLKNRKIQLNQEIKEIEEKLIERKEYEEPKHEEPHHNPMSIPTNIKVLNTNNDCNSIETEAPDADQRDSLNNEVIEMISLSNDEMETNQMNLNSLNLSKNEDNCPKRKQKQKKKSIIKNTDSKKYKNHSKDIISENLVNNKNEVIISSIEDNYTTNEVNETTTEPNGDLQQRQNLRISTENSCQSNNNSAIDWRDNYVDFAFNFSSPEERPKSTSPSTATTTSTVTSCESIAPLNPITKSLYTFESSAIPQSSVRIKNTNLKTLNEPKNVIKRKFESNHSFRGNHKRHSPNNSSKTGGNETLYDVSHRTNCTSVPIVTCLHSNDNELYVGIQTGVINKYNICGDSLVLCDPLPQMNSDITALHYIKKFNYLYCGTINGQFSYVNIASNNIESICLNLRNRITCFESSPTILFIGTTSKLIYRFGLMSNEMVNNFKCDFGVINLKLMNDSSDRIIVCHRYEISIRNSTDGSLLQTVDKCGDNCYFICANIIGNNVVICSNTVSDFCHRFQIYENSFRKVLKDIRHELIAKFVTNEGNCLYVYTKQNFLYCFDIERVWILWSIKIECKLFDITFMTVNNKRVIIGTRFGKIMQIIPDLNAPIVCESNTCGNGFPRICDIVEHFRDHHALPFYRLNPNIHKFFRCQWNGCDLRIKNNNESVRMIVEHMKTHVI